MLKLRLLFLLLLVIFSSSHLILAQDATEEACPLEDGVLTIAWIPKALNNPVFELGRIGAETRAAELSAAGPCQVEIFYTAPMSSTADEQADLITEVMMLPSTDAIGVSCIDPEACIAPINAAVSNSIPVMTWDSDSPESDRFTYLGIDNYEGGQAAADLLVRAMGDSGQVALLSGVPGSANLEERIDGFKDAMAAYPNIELVTIVYSDDLATRGVEVVEEVMTTYPDLNGWFFVGLWPLLVGQGAMPQWEAATMERGLVTVAFDTLPLELDLMRDGYLHGLVGQKYWGWGYDTVQMLYDRVLYAAEFEDFTNTGLDIVTPLNLEAMSAAWENNDFTQPLPAPFEATPEPTQEAN